MRLRALADSPAVFASTLEVEAAHPQSYWAELLASAAVFLAGGFDACLGMAAGRWYDRGRGVAQLWGLWIDPSARGCGLGGRLVA
ncbi:MAG: hypothetical protein QOF04_140, partial [Solirubrobacteraceae bacterium]|nr:hypothetical protein [Solirubrobacteraceae bacterium]